MEKANNPSFFNRHLGCIIASSSCLVFIGFLIFGFFGFLIYIGSLGSKMDSSEQEVLSGTGTNKIAVVNVDGIIVEREPAGGLDSLSGTYASSRRINKTLKQISEDNDVKAVILKVNSPGGSAAASEEIYTQLVKLKKDTNKNIVAYFSDTAASGGYYISMGTDEIIANPQTITGSIGVIISYLNFSELATKYGISEVVYKSGEFKDIGNSFKKPTNEEDKIMQSLIDDAYDVFVNKVATGRKMSVADVKKIADGRVFSAKSAKEANLIDNIGDFDLAVLRAKKLAGITEAKVVEYGKPSFWELMKGAKFLNFNLEAFQSLNNYFDLKLSPKLLYLYTP
ncbi:MAG: signal peptide peptidase SppA [Actinobacteria bacterium]|nr:signal peptide peptidase SppA [Actinomycetota bacterium]